MQGSGEMGWLELEGKAVIVTGGAAGIGRACREGLAGAGASVVVADINEEGASALAGELADAATFLFKLAYQCGIDLEDALKSNMTKAEDRFSVAYGQADTERYLARQAEHLERIQKKGIGEAP